MFNSRAWIRTRWETGTCGHLTPRPLKAPSDRPEPKFPVLSQIKLQAPWLVAPFHQFIWGPALEILLVSWEDAGRSRESRISRHCLCWNYDDIWSLNLQLSFLIHQNIPGKCFPYMTLLSLIFLICEMVTKLRFVAGLEITVYTQRNVWYTIHHCF